MNPRPLLAAATAAFLLAPVAESVAASPFVLAQLLMHDD